MKTTNYKKTLRKLFFVLTTVSLLVFSGQKTYATHAAGADLQFCWVSGNTYQFTYIFYRNCHGTATQPIPTAAPASILLRITSASCGISLQTQISQDPQPNGLEVSLA